MALHLTRPYDVYLVLGDPAQTSLWSWERWRPFAAALDPLVAAAGGEAEVDCFQHSRQTKAMRPVSFGALGWSEADHAKWAHGSPRNADVSRGWIFHRIRVWAPSREAAWQRGEPPDLFLSFANERSSRQQCLALEKLAAAAPAAPTKRRPKAIDTFPITRAEIEAFFRERAIPFAEPDLIRVVEQSADELAVLRAIQGLREVGTAACLPSLKARARSASRLFQRAAMIVLAEVAKGAETRFYTTFALEHRDYKEKDYALHTIVRHGTEDAVGAVVGHLVRNVGKLGRGGALSPAAFEAVLWLVRHAARVQDSRVSRALDAIWGRWDSLGADERERLRTQVPYLRAKDDHARNFASSPVRFDNSFLLAARAGKSDAFTRLAREHAVRIAGELGAVLRATLRQPWGPWGRGDLAYMQEIGGLPTGVFKLEARMGGRLHAAAPHLGSLEGNWKEF